MELKEAVIMVLITKYKKDAPEAFKTVTDAGYQVYKVNGNFRIYNPEVKRELHFGRGSYRVYGWLYGANSTKRCATLEELTEVDVVGILNTPKNYDKIPTNYGSWYETETQAKIGRLRDAKRGVKYADESIARARENLENARRELEDAVEYKVEKEYALKECRKELGIKGVA